MNDRELLEFAAKAHGHIELSGEKLDFFDCKTKSWWRPLTDDGDALRLAVKLDLLRFPEVSFFPQAEDDELEATRRAIVLAAAEIGKTK